MITQTEDIGTAKWQLLLFTLLITFFVMLPALQGELLNWDDHAYITDNKVIKRTPFSNLPELFSTPVNQFYVPLTLLSFQLEYAVAGLSPRLYHTTNLLLHLANTALVFMLIFHWSNRKIAALVAALLFGLHTMNVESVAWVSERKDLLYTFFGLSGLLAYHRYTVSGKYKWLGFTWLAFVASLAAKPQWLLYPAILLLADYRASRPLRQWQVWAEKLPFLLVSGLMVALLLSQLGGAVDPQLASYTLPDRVLFSAYQLFQYYWRLWLPVSLSATYPYPVAVNGWYAAEVYIGAALATGLTLGLLWLAYRRSAILLFGLLFYLINISVVLQLASLNTSLHYDRFNYVPYIGFFLLIGTGVDYLWQMQRWRWVMIPIAAWIFLLGILSFQRTQIWRNDERLYSDIIAKNPANREILYARAQLYVKQRRFAEAMQDISAAIALSPGTLKYYETRIGILEQTNSVAAAVNDFNTLLKYRPNDDRLLMGRGAALAAAGKPEAALNDYLAAVKVNNNNADAFFNMGNLFLQQGYPDEAAACYREVLRINPSDVGAIQQLRRLGSM